MTTFLEQLHAAAHRNSSFLCIGLDPDPDLMPIPDVFDFNKAIIDATHDLVCAYKPNVAFYDGIGESGHQGIRAASVDAQYQHFRRLGLPGLEAGAGRDRERGDGVEGQDSWISGRHGAQD